VPALPLQTDAFVLLKRPASDKFQGFTVFSAEHGLALVLQRTSKNASATAPVLDLFDEVALALESSNQGQTWFVKEARLLHRPTEIGRSYEALRLASALASLVARNPAPEESRAGIAQLLRQAFAAFAAGTRPDVVWLKSLYRFARDEGYPVREDWFAKLPPADRDGVAGVLNRPLTEQTAKLPAVARLTQRLEAYLRLHTEILLE